MSFPYLRIFAALDGASTQEAVARRAIALAAASGAQLLFGHVVDVAPSDTNGADFEALAQEEQVRIEQELADVLAEAGAEIIADSCPDQPCWHYLKGKVGITESPKCAYYPRRRGIHFIIRDLDTCIQAALTGEVN